MARKDSPQNVIDSYRKRQQMMPYLVGGLAALLVIIGIIILVMWFAGPNRPAIALFASATPTSTNTPTVTPVTPTLTPSLTPTETLTPTVLTPTPSGPFEYTVQELDNCWAIAEEFDVDMLVLLAINNFGTECPIKPGDTILIPAPDTKLPTETPFPTELARGTKIEYVVKIGDTLDIIASKFNSTKEAIIKENKIEDPNTLIAGQTLVIPYNIATPTATRPVTITPQSTGAAPSSTATP